MEVKSLFRNHPPGLLDAQATSVVDNLHPLPAEEGVFLSSELPEFEAQVNEITSAPHELSRYGRIQHEVFTMDDGETYPVVTGFPKNARSDTALVFTTAWLTSTKGHNRHTLYRMMELGYPTIMIGPEGEIRNPQLTRAERFHKARAVSLPKVAYDMNRILDTKLADMDVRQDEVITLGESRGAMTGFGFDVEQYSGSRRMVYGDLTAPCFARLPKLSEAPDIVAQLGPELLTLGGLAFKLAGKLRHYPATLHSDPEYYAKELFKMPILMSGQAGALAKATHKDTPMHIKNFVGDRWSQSEEWKRVFGQHTQVELEPAKGYHLAIANPRTLHEIGVRLNTLTEARGFDGSFASVNFKNVLNAHLNQEKDMQRKSFHIGRLAMKGA